MANVFIVVHQRPNDLAIWHPLHLGLANPLVDTWGGDDVVVGLLHGIVHGTYQGGNRLTLKRVF